MKKFVLVILLLLVFIVVYGATNPEKQGIETKSVSILQGKKELRRYAVVGVSKGSLMDAKNSFKNLSAKILAEDNDNEDMFLVILYTTNDYRKAEKKLLKLKEKGVTNYGKRTRYMLPDAKIVEISEVLLQETDGIIEGKPFSYYVESQIQDIEKMELEQNTNYIKKCFASYVSGPELKRYIVVGSRTDNLPNESSPYLVGRRYHKQALAKDEITGKYLHVLYSTDFLSEALKAQIIAEEPGVKIGNHIFQWTCPWILEVVSDSTLITGADDYENAFKGEAISLGNNNKLGIKRYIGVTGLDGKPPKRYSIFVPSSFSYSLEESEAKADSLSQQINTMVKVLKYKDRYCLVTYPSDDLAETLEAFETFIKKFPRAWIMEVFE